MNIKYNLKSVNFNPRQVLKNQSKRNPLGVIAIINGLTFLLWDEDILVYEKIMGISVHDNPLEIGHEEFIAFERMMVQKYVNHSIGMIKPLSESHSCIEYPYIKYFKDSNEYSKYSNIHQPKNDSVNAVKPKILNYCEDRKSMMDLLTKEDKFFDESTVFIQNKGYESYVLIDNDAHLYSKLSKKVPKDVYVLNKNEYMSMLSMLESNSINYAVIKIDEKNKTFIPTKIIKTKNFQINQYELHLQDLSSTRVNTLIEKSMKYQEEFEKIEAQVKAKKNHAKQLSKDIPSDKPTWEDMRKGRYKDFYR